MVLNSMPLKSITHYDTNDHSVICLPLNYGKPSYSFSRTITVTENRNGRDRTYFTSLVGGEK